jgi:hypothetical protein
MLFDMLYTYQKQKLSQPMAQLSVIFKITETYP